ncbi:MAG: alanine racemase [Thermoanaerobaculales bacterium]|jgi:alanine racemase|nr:alanine racemase [Thermoanaerobaculales bacterium]
MQSFRTLPAQWIELDAKALVHNSAVFRSMVPSTTALLGVVKSNAYGHGLGEVAGVVADRLDWFGVHSAAEARRLRRLGITKPILVMGVVPPSELHDLDHDIHLLAASTSALNWIGDYRSSSGVSLPVHLKIDTGTKRQGIPLEDLNECLRTAAKNRLDVTGLATHFANIEDTLEHEFAREQLDRFHLAVEAATRGLGHRPPYLHAACSAATLLFRQTDFSLVRLGISLYGHWPSRETRLSLQLDDPHDRIELRNVLSWRAMVGQLQRVSRGETVGYGRTWTALRETALAVIPVGYADGYPRELGNRSRVAVRGVGVPVVGRVCMNILMVDVTDIPDVRIGDTVTLLGRDGETVVTAEELAAHCGTINYEFLARLSPAIPRVVRP